MVERRIQGKDSLGRLTVDAARLAVSMVVRKVRADDDERLGTSPQHIDHLRHFFDGRIALDPTTLNQRWRDLCLGATQDVLLDGGNLYGADHAHDCTTMGGFSNGRRQHLTVEPTVITVDAGFAGRTVRYKLAVHPPRRREVTLSAQRLVNGHWHTFRTVVRDANRILTRSITARTTDRTVQLVVTVPAVRVGAEVYRAARVVKTIRR